MEEKTGGNTMNGNRTKSSFLDLLLKKVLDMEMGKEQQESYLE